MPEDALSVTGATQRRKSDGRTWLLGRSNERLETTEDALLLKYEGGDVCPHNGELRATTIVFVCKQEADLLPSVRPLGLPTFIAEVRQRKFPDCTALCLKTLSTHSF